MVDLAVPLERTERPAPGLKWLGLGTVGIVSLTGLYGAWTLHILGQSLLATIILIVIVGFAIIFSQRRFYAARFIYPGIAAILIFVLFPMIYTIYLGFTNYSSTNLLSFGRVQEILLSQTIIAPDTERPYALVAEGAQYRLFFAEGDGGFLTEPLPLDGAEVMAPAAAVTAPPAETLAMRDVVKLREALEHVEVTLPDGGGLKLSGLRTFASVTPALELQPDGRLVSTADGSVLTPDHSVGFYIDDAGARVTPGWRVEIGLANFARVFGSAGIRQPMVAIFFWTIAFAGLSVGLTFALGVILATILQWPHLRFKPVYRLLLILPYSVPAFISILIFKGLFNQNFGEINVIIEAVLGFKPTWNTDAGLARTMIVIVNVWLGYPYMMLLAMGFLQSVPEDQKKAAALEGASPLRVFFTITLPQILPPFLPLLIASFAFNFNNLVLVLLLTRGLPDMPGTVVPAGHTDILGSFTYRISFLNSGQEFGLAGAITLLIFLLVTVIAYANFIAMRRVANRGGQQ